MRCGDAISDLFRVVTGVVQECVMVPTLFSFCIDWILGRMSQRSSCSASSGNVKISDLEFLNDSIFVETVDILKGALRELNEESMTSWMLLSCLHLFMVRLLMSWRDSW